MNAWTCKMGWYGLCIMGRIERVRARVLGQNGMKPRQTDTHTGTEMENTPSFLMINQSRQSRRAYAAKETE